MDRRLPGKQAPRATIDDRQLAFDPSQVCAIRRDEPRLHGEADTVRPRLRFGTERHVLDRRLRAPEVLPGDVAEGEPNPRVHGGMIGGVDSLPRRMGPRHGSAVGRVDIREAGAPHGRIVEEELGHRRILPPDHEPAVALRHGEGRRVVGAAGARQREKRRHDDKVDDGSHGSCAGSRTTRAIASRSQV